MPGASVVQHVIDTSADAVWDFVSDLETSIPRFDRTVRHVRILQHDGEILHMRVKPNLGPTLAFTCHLGEYRVVMAAHRRLYLVGIALRPLGPAHTLYAQVEGIPHRAGRLVNSFTSRHVTRDAAAVKHLVEGRNP